MVYTMYMNHSNRVAKGNVYAMKDTEWGRMWEIDDGTY